MAKDTGYEPLELLSGETREMHRAITSLMEELEAIDSYQRRADVCREPQLKAVLLHNKNEEIEHASMLIEWIRRHNDRFNEMLRKFLFTEQPITGIEKGAGTDSAAATITESPGIGGMKGI